MVRTSTLGLALYLFLGLTLAAVSDGPDSKEAGWKSLFDGKSLGNWKQTAFTGGGRVRVEEKFKDEGPAILVEAGDALSGFNWAPEKKGEKGKAQGETAEGTEKKIEIPKTNYEISLEAMKIKGDDFMCGLTFPVGDSHASLILGGWGGMVVGISSIDKLDASENSTTKYMPFPKDRWFKIRLRVTPAKLEAWLDGEQIVDQEIAGKKISLRAGEIDLSVPLGISTFQTTSAFRNIRLRTLDPAKQKGDGKPSPNAIR